jgi:F0F1-type ATP synthase membrane subunit b/b'
MQLGGSAEVNRLVCTIVRRPHGYSNYMREESMKFNTGIATAIVLILVITGLAACEKGPAQKAGEAIDNAAKKVGEKAEEAGDKIKDAAKDARDDATKKVGKKVEEASDKITDATKEAKK